MLNVTDKTKAKLIWSILKNRHAAVLDLHPVELEVAAAVLKEMKTIPSPDSEVIKEVMLDRMLQDREQIVRIYQAGLSLAEMHYAISTLTERELKALMFYASVCDWLEINGQPLKDLIRERCDALACHSEADARKCADDFLNEFHTAA